MTFFLEKFRLIVTQNPNNSTEIYKLHYTIALLVFADKAVTIQFFTKFHLTNICANCIRKHPESSKESNKNISRTMRGAKNLKAVPFLCRQLKVGIVQTRG